MERMTELGKSVEESKAQQLERKRLNKELEKKIEEQSRYISDKFGERSKDRRVDA